MFDLNITESSIGFRPFQAHQSLQLSKMQFVPTFHALSQIYMALMRQNLSSGEGGGANNKGGQRLCHSLFGKNHI